MKFPKSPAEPSVTCSYIWHIKMNILIRQTICKCLVDIHDFRHEYSSIECKICNIKHNKIKGNSIICFYIWHIDILKCVYWLDIHFAKIWWRYVLPNANTSHFCDVFFRHRAVLLTCPEKRPQKSKLRLIKDQPR